MRDDIASTQEIAVKVAERRGIPVRTRLVKAGGRFRQGVDQSALDAHVSFRAVRSTLRRLHRKGKVVGIPGHCRILKGSRDFRQATQVYYVTHRRLIVLLERSGAVYAGLQVIAYRHADELREVLATLARGEEVDGIALDGHQHWGRDGRERLIRGLKSIMNGDVTDSPEEVAL